MSKSKKLRNLIIVSTLLLFLNSIGACAPVAMVSAPSPNMSETAASASPATTPIRITGTPLSNGTGSAANAQVARYIIILVADGWGINQIEATNAYTNNTPVYQSWAQHWVSTFPVGGNYDPTQAWANFDYVETGITDSAAAATALYTGVKTDNGKISVSASNQRLFSIADKARSLGKAVGAVSSVYISHATPGAWYAHNDDRDNGFAIADEGLFGDPNTTSAPNDDSRYGGGHGPTLPPVDVLIGAGHPYWQGDDFVNLSIYDKLVAESGQFGASTFVERIAGSPDGGSRLLSVANDPTVTRLVGLFGGTGGNLDYRLADGSGYDPENPTLEEMTKASISVLSRDPEGYVLMIEGGAVDWSNHDNNMDHMIGEMIDFNSAVQAVIDWVDDPANTSSWSNTLVIVTGDHEAGYLTAGPGVFAGQPLGEVSENTLTKEKTIESTGRRASWEDLNNNDEIDDSEAVYWAWNSDGHTNSLIPLYAKGVGVELFDTYATGSDPVRSAYLDNTDVFRVMDAVTSNFRTLIDIYLPLSIHRR
jgi:alkaline phosphatase